MKVAWLDEIGVWPTETVLTVGVFDGVHAGHRDIMRTVRAAADRRGCTAVAMTFAPHPAEAVAPAERPVLLTTLDQRIELLGALGLDAVVIVRHLRSLFTLEAEEFAEEIVVRALRAQEVVEGGDWTFGRRRRGDLCLLGDLGARLHFAVTEVPWTTVGGPRVSSTAIRAMVREGNVVSAAAALGRHYFVDGTVVKGAGRGAGLGFPTANLAPENELLPPGGVYAGWGAVAGRAFPAAIFIGASVTFRAKATACEAHLLDYTGGDLRGQRMRVHFVRRLRDVRAFPDVPALVEQIGTDVDEVRRFLGPAILAEATPVGGQG